MNEQFKDAMTAQALGQRNLRSGPGSGLADRLTAQYGETCVPPPRPLLINLIVSASEALEAQTKEINELQSRLVPLLGWPAPVGDNSKEVKPEELPQALDMVRALIKRINANTDLIADLHNRIQL